MNIRQEFLQRFLDDDLSDAEMKELFLALGRSPSLRKEFRALLQLREGLRNDAVSVPAAMEDRVRAVLPPPVTKVVPFPAAFVRRRFTFSLAAAAAALLLMLAAGYAAAISFTGPSPQKTYVYVVELPAYVVGARHSYIVNN